MTRIFISYRRDDSAGFAGRLYDRLGAHFGPENVFMDIDAIEPGLDFVEVIEQAVSSCDVLIALIGPRWLAVTDARGRRRLDNPADFVRLEIKAALDRNIRVIPTLVGGAAMPASGELPAELKPLARRNALEIGARFHPDVDSLIELLEKVLAPAPPEPKPAAPTRHPFEPELILIPAGDFLMGSDPKKDKQADDDEQPQHRLFLPIYSIAKTPVTNAQFAAFVQATNYQPPSLWESRQPPADTQDHPVVRVSWHDAVAYCRWLAEVTAKPYRLPTEAEWEKAARGPDGRIYPWGNEWDKNRCNTQEGGKGRTTPVGFYPNGASPYGVLDMAGNVWEWCATKWKKKAYPYDIEEDEWTADYLAGTDNRVQRGGTWFNIRRLARCAGRLGYNPELRGTDEGFRVAVSPSSW
ncbi:MAG: SUMF1/EgtB/PvdO family nonheme iron enzyme [Chloroflexota bacterium]